VIRSPLFALAAGMALAATPAFGQGRVAGTLASASDVLDELQAIPLKCIPPALLKDAHGVAIIPGVVKAGFVVGGRFGHGVVLARTPDGGWADPVFVSLTGGGIGFQAGVQSTDVVLVFKTRRGLNQILEGKSKVTLGGDLSVAAGPVGRQAEAATDAQLKSEIYSYSRSRGLFAGASIEGAAIVADHDANRAFARRDRPEVLAAADKLKIQLVAMTSGRPIVTVPPPGAVIVPAPPPSVPPVPVPPPPGGPVFPPR
jgi:lipid-binding SYLF domain-containing protein